MKKRFTTTLMAAALTVGLTVSVMAAETQPIRVSSYKGNTLEVGERSGLIIGPSWADCTVISSDPDIVAIKQVLTFWVVVANAEGTAEITATSSTGECGALTLTVDSVAPTEPANEDSDTLTDNMEIRQEIIRLINQTRRANGVSELPINEALMTAAQTCSDRRYTWHHTQEECEAAAVAGYPYGFGDNLIGVHRHRQRRTTRCRQLDQLPGHFQTMIDPTADCIGVGVTQHDGITYCYMFVGIPNSVSFYG